MYVLRCVLQAAKKENALIERRSVQQTKKEKRDRRTVSADGMTRRSFLTFLGMGSAALAAGSSGVLPREAAALQGSENFAGAASTPYPDAGANGAGINFTPIEASSADELILPEGYKYDVVRRWGEPVTSDGRTFGFNNDYVAYFPIDALEGGANSRDGLLYVNHEYVDSKWVSGFVDENGAERTPQQIAQEKEAVGGSVIRVRKEGGAWAFVEDEKFNRRIDANTPMGATGPAAGSAEMRMKNKKEVIGTLANCSGGVTPWNTVLTCEENYQYYYGQRTPEEGVEGISTDDEVNSDATWLNDPKNVQPPEHYGWVVEVDPFDRKSRPRKHTWLGRVRHENVALTISKKSGRIVAYTGHDQPDECIYKFVSSGAYNPDDREKNMELLSDGMLYVADFANGRWVALDYENNSIFKDNSFRNQADVLVRAPEAAKLSEEEDGPPIGTPM